jgi:hypothetical protein
VPRRPGDVWRVVVTGYVLTGYELLLVLWGAIWITGSIALMAYIARQIARVDRQEEQAHLPAPIVEMPRPSQEAKELAAVS